MNENAINEVFDFDPQTAETADQSAGDGTAEVDAGFSEGEADVTDGASGAGALDGDSTQEGVSSEGGQSPEENKRYAAARRAAEAERDKAYAERDKVLADAKKAQDDLVASMGLIDPYTGKAVTTKEQFDAYKQASAEAHKKSFMQKNGLDEAGYNKFVGQLPEVVRANEAIAKAEAAAESARRSEASKRIDAEIEIISKLDPDIKSKEDLYKLDNYGEIFEKVKKGHSISDAYKLVNFEKLTARSAAAEKQRALNAQASKGHLSPTSGAHGQHLAPVPAADKAIYQYLNPDMSDEDIARDYNRRLKK